MGYLRIPNEITDHEVLEKGASWSPGMYPRVSIPTSTTKRVGDLLEKYTNGLEVGSLAYVKQSPYSLIRTKALQDFSLLTQLKGESIINITPQAYFKAVQNHPDRMVKDGDILYARGGSVGEIAIADKCGAATISGHMLRLQFKNHPYYCLAFMKHSICKLQQQPNVKGSISALDNFSISTLLDCIIPFPNQEDAEKVIVYVSALTEAITDKEKAIRDKSETINNIIQMELITRQKNTMFQYEYPRIEELRDLGRLDAAIYGQEYKSKISLVRSYLKGSVTPEEDGFIVTPGPSLEIKIIGTRLDSDTHKPGFYALILPTNISVYGTMNAIAYLGTAKKLPLLQSGDIVFGEAGFQKGRSIVLLDGIDNCTTNAHGLYARRADENIARSIYFRCVFNWYRNNRLIDLMGVGGSGGHFSPEYFNYLRIPNFPDHKQNEIVELYHHESLPPSTPPTLNDFVEWHRKWNLNLGIWELHREMKALQQKLSEIQEQIIEGKTVRVPENLTYSSPKSSPKKPEVYESRIDKVDLQQPSLFEFS